MWDHLQLQLYLFTSAACHAESVFAFFPFSNIQTLMYEIQYFYINSAVNWKKIMRYPEKYNLKIQVHAA